MSAEISLLKNAFTSTLGQIKETNNMRKEGKGWKVVAARSLAIAGKIIGFLGLVSAALDFLAGIGMACTVIGIPAALLMFAKAAAVAYAFREIIVLSDNVLKDTSSKVFKESKPYLGLTTKAARNLWTIKAGKWVAENVK